MEIKFIGFPSKFTLVLVENGDQLVPGSSYMKGIDSMMIEYFYANMH